MEDPQKALSVRLEKFRNSYTLPKFPFKGKIVIAILAVIIILYGLCLVYVAPDNSASSWCDWGSPRCTNRGIWTRFVFHSSGHA